MAAEEIIAVVTCPWCGENDAATVHLTAKKARYYVRCYQGIGGSAQVCGSLLAYGPAGQKRIREALDAAHEIRRPDLMPGGAKPPEPTKGDSTKEPDPDPAPTADTPAPEPAPSKAPDPEPEPAREPVGAGWLLDL